ncbi:MAG: 3-deoxy-D-manno-octulosonic acid transferase [Bacteroidales bacterium]|nr:3-deoxy-D-manno-octulosonic acid transferase [Bacteroidales bacterium]
MRLLYTLFIHLYSLGALLASPFSLQARQWWQGRRHLLDLLKEKCQGKQNIIWIHSASLGEFEQGKPLMERIRKEHPECSILLTFFSPSGYEIRKNEPLADVVAYLPADTLRNVRRFLDIVQPKAAIFVKYEYWFNYMDALYKRQIPFYYISAIYRPSQHFFKWYGGWFVRQLKKCTHFFVQNAISQQLLNSIGIHNVTIAGDTRFDRVYAIAQQDYTLDFAVRFKGDSQLIVAGSTWEPDEQLLRQVFEAVHDRYKLILAPHMIDSEHIKSIKNLFSDYKVLCYTEMEGQPIEDYQVLIIDTIGLLSKIYKYSDLSYIGGAFGKGLHNILEAGVFGVPLFFGPKYSKFNEAVELVSRGGAFSIQTAEEMTTRIQQFSAQPEQYGAVCDICRTFVQENLGAVDKIMAKQFRINNL